MDIKFDNLLQDGETTVSPRIICPEFSKAFQENSDLIAAQWGFQQKIRGGKILRTKK